MGEGTSEIRSEIEETRFRVGEEVEALSHKTDVGGRIGEYVDEKKEAVASKLDSAKSAVGSAVPSPRQMKVRARRMDAMAHSNPLGVAIGAAAVGFVAGLLVPSTRVEDEKLGEAATRVRETVSEVGQEAVERGKDVAESAMQTAREEGAQQGRELASDLTGRLQEETRYETQGGGTVR